MRDTTKRTSAQSRIGLILPLARVRVARTPVLYVVLCVCALCAGECPVRSYGPGGNEGAFIPLFSEPPVTHFKALFLLLPSALSFLQPRSWCVKRTPRENVEGKMIDLLGKKSSTHCSPSLKRIDTRAGQSQGPLA